MRTQVKLLFVLAIAMGCVNLPAISQESISRKLVKLDDGRTCFEIGATEDVQIFRADCKGQYVKHKDTHACCTPESEIANF